jgi:hypothetical protein
MGVFSAKQLKECQLWSPASKAQQPTSRCYQDAMPPWALRWSISLHPRNNSITKDAGSFEASMHCHTLQLCDKWVPVLFLLGPLQNSGDKLACLKAHLRNHCQCSSFQCDGLSNTDIHSGRYAIRWILPYYLPSSYSARTYNFFWVHSLKSTVPIIWTWYPVWHHKQA